MVNKLILKYKQFINLKENIKINYKSKTIKFIYNYYFEILHILLSLF